MSLPPGPPLPPAIQTLLYFLRPVAFLDECHRRYGPTFTIETALFGKEVCVTRPEDIKQIFTGDPDVHRAGEANTLLEPLVGSNSVLLLDGAKHLRQRRLMMPPFHGERMQAYGRTMREATERAIRAWPVGSPFALHPFMQRITLDVIVRTIFGATEGPETAALSEALTTLLDRQSSPAAIFTTIPALRHEFFGIGPWAEMQRDLRRADRIIYDLIATRRKEVASGSAPPRTDVLALMLEARDEHGEAMTDLELRDELVTLLAAGHETTATELCWAFDLLLGDRRVLDKLRAELAGAGPGDAPSVAKLEYLDATVKETLRMRPVIPAVGRRLSQPTRVAGYDLPAGTLLVPAVYLTHHDPSIYPEPEAFRPERFVGTKPDPYAWLPFGGGIRRCLGMTFATYEMKVVIATILRSVELRRAKPTAAAVGLRAFTYAPKGGTEVVVERRIAPPRAAQAATAAA